MTSENGDGSRELDPPPRRPGRRRAMAGSLVAVTVLGVGFVLTWAGRGSQTRILTRSPASAAVPVEPSRSGPTVVRSGGRRTHPPAEIVAIEGDAVIVVDSASGNTKRVL